MHVDHGINLQLGTSLIHLIFTVVKLLSLFAYFFMVVKFTLFEALETKVAEGFVYGKHILRVRTFALKFSCYHVNLVWFACLTVIWAICASFNWFCGANLRRFQDFLFFKSRIAFSAFSHCLIVLIWALVADNLFTWLFFLLLFFFTFIFIIKTIHK